MKTDKKGKVYLVGAGPGDPGLLTIKAKECLEQADVVLHDYLANSRFLEYAKEDAELIYVGKKSGSHSMSQDDINKLICEKAEQGLNVVRLKGGDPFIFGRGGEEAQKLVKACISFEIVPGVTSAIAVPAYAGIPLTHRDYESIVSFVTGHEDPKKEKSKIDWQKLSTGMETIVFLMGVGNLEGISKKLIENGRSPDTPVAVIQKGTVNAQRTVVGRLDNIAKIVKEEGITSPGIIVVGKVVDLRSELKWFEDKPLFGKKIIITRARVQASEFINKLTELGAECVEFPTIRIVPPDTWEALDRSINSLDSYDWIIFTSVNGVKYFFRRLNDLGMDTRDLKGIRIGTIGPKTAEAVQEKGIKPDLVPEEYRAEAIVEAFKKDNLKGLRMMLPRAANARNVLPQELIRMGAHVEVVEVYRTTMPEDRVDEVREMLQLGMIHMITFTSSSTVTNFMSMFKEDKDIKKWMENVDIACIGPITAKTAQDMGLNVILTPEKYTIESLTDSIVEHYLNT